MNRRSFFVRLVAGLVAATTSAMHAFRHQFQQVSHRSKEYERTEYHLYEAAFAKAWEEENTPVYGVNYGLGALTLLLSPQRPGKFWQGWNVHYPTQEEATAAATVIQWLGSNCGYGFLCEVLEKCGYTLTGKGLPHGGYIGQTSL